MLKTEKKQGVLLEELDPRMKMLIVIVVSIICFTAENQKVFLRESVLIVLLFMLRGLFRQGVKAAGILGMFFLVEMATCYIPTEGVRMTVNLLVFFVGRMLIVFIMSYWMSQKMRVGDFVTALQKMHLPKGLTITFAVVFRYLPTVKDEFGKIYNTMKLRGISINAENLLKHPIKTFEYAIIPLILRSLAIADQLAASAVTRGMDLEKEKTSYRTVKLERWDIGATICIVGLAVGGMYL